MRQNVHFKGIDRKQGQVILEKGRRLGAPEMNIAAAVGKDEGLQDLERRIVPVPSVLLLSLQDRGAVRHIARQRNAASWLSHPVGHLGSVTAVARRLGLRNILIIPKTDQDTLGELATRSFPDFVVTDCDAIVVLARPVKDFL